MRAGVIAIGLLLTPVVAGTQATNPDTARLRNIRPLIQAGLAKVAKEFYTSKLGFQVVCEASDDGKIGLLGLARGTIQITLDSPMDGHGRTACVSLEVESADAYFGVE